MNRRPGDKITPEIARDICERTASKAMIAGGISQLGQSYVISLDASNCRTGDTIEKRQVQAASKDEVLKALGSAAEQLRRGLGESLASIEKYDAPIQGATTASLDALKAYSQGMVMRRRQSDADSMPFFRKAIDVDPEFALAHARLSTVYGNMGEDKLSREHITKAYGLRDRVSEPERLYILARYYTLVEGSVQKAIDTYQVWIQTYPKDFVPHANVAGMYADRNQDDRAIAEYRTAISLAPDEPLPYSNLAGLYRKLDRHDDARRLLEDAIARGVDSAGFRTELFTIAALNDDEAEMTRQVEAARRFSDGPARMQMTQLSLALYRGQLTRAKEAAAQYGEEAARLKLKGSAAAVWSDVAQSAAVFGDVVSTRAAVRSSLELDRNLKSLLNGAIAFAVCGDEPAARKMLDEAATMPGAASEDAQFTFKLTDALIRWRQGDKSAGETLPLPSDGSNTGAAFMKGVIDLHDGRPEAAAERFKPIADGKLGALNPLRPIAWLYYGRAMAKVAKPDEARQAYDTFFEQMKRADAELPILVAAKTEYAQLQK
jgi:tetratricopeptide (TPR) repeat protein